MMAGEKAALMVELKVDHWVVVKVAKTADEMVALTVVRLVAM